MTNKKSATKTSPTKPKETKPENTNNTENPKSDDSNDSHKTDNSNDASTLNEKHSSSNVEITNQDPEITSNGKERSPKSEDDRLTKRAKVLFEGDVGSEWQCTFYGNDSNTSNENNTSNEVV